MSELTDRVRWAFPSVNRQIFLFFAYSALFHIGLLGIVDVVLNFYFVSLGHGPETIGILQSFPRMGGLLTGIPIGLLSNRLGAHRVLVYSTIGVAGSVLILIILPGLVFLAISRFLLGSFFGANQIVTSPFMMTLTKTEHHTQLFSYRNTVTMAAIAFGSFVGGFLPSLIVQLMPDLVAEGEASTSPNVYRAVLLAAILVILASASLFRWIAGPQITHKQSNPRFIGVPWRHLVILSLPMLFFGFTGGLTFPFLNLFFRTVFDLSDGSVGAVISLGWMGMGLVTLANPWLEQHLGRAYALGMTMSIAATAFLGLSIARSLIVAIPIFLIAISVRNTMQPIYQPMVMGVSLPDLRNTLSSVGLVIWNIGWFSATAVSGFWQKAYGFDFIMQVVAIGLFVTAASTVLIFGQRQPYQDNLKEDVA